MDCIQGLLRACSFANEVNGEIPTDSNRSWVERSVTACEDMLVVLEVRERTPLETEVHCFIHTARYRRAVRV